MIVVMFAFVVVVVLLVGRAVRVMHTGACLSSRE